MKHEQERGRDPGAAVAGRAFSARDVANAGAWTVLGFGGAQLVRLGANLVLTRIIPDAPAAYGVMAVVLAIYTGIGFFSDVGVGLLLTQHARGAAPEFRRTAFTAQAVRGAMIWLVAIALSPLFAAAYPDYSGLQELVVAVSAAGLIAGFSSTSIHMLTRDLRVDRLARLNLGAQVFGSAVTIAHALWSPSVWALVSGTLASAVFKALVSHSLTDERDRFGWDREAAAQLLQMGRWVFLSTALTFAVMQADRLIFGKLVSMEELGVYSVSLIFSVAAFELLSKLSQSVLFPVLCRSQGDRAELEAAFVRLRVPILAFGGAVLTGLCAGGGALMDLLYTGGFERGGWMLRIAAGGVWFSACMQVPRAQVLLAVGQPKWTAAANLAKVVAMCVLIPVGFYVAGFGGAIFGYAVTECVRYAVTVFRTGRLGVGGFTQDVRWTAWIALAVLVASWVEAALADDGAPAWGRCLAVGAVAVAFWLRPALLALRSFK